MAAEFLCGGVDILLHAHGVVLDVRLLQEAVCLVELADLAVDHLLLDLLGLLCVLLIIVDLRLDDLALLGDSRCGNSLAVEVLNRVCSGLQRDVFCKFCKACVVLCCIVSLKLNHNADCAAAVNIGAGRAVHNDEATEVEFLTDGENHFLYLVFDRHVGVLVLASLECIHISGLVCNNGLKQAADKLTEALVLCDKVGLGVDLDHCGGVACGQNVNKTVRCDSVSFLCGNGKTSLAENLDCLIHVALSLDERLLALHHAAAGLFSQLGNIFCGNVSHLSASFPILYNGLKRIMG